MKKTKFEIVIPFIFSILMVTGLIFMGYSLNQIGNPDIKYQTFAMLGSIIATISVMMSLFLFELKHLDKK